MGIGYEKDVILTIANQLRVSEVFFRTAKRQACVTTCRFNWACYCDNAKDGDLRNFEAVFIVAFAGCSAGDRQCPKPHRSRCAHDKTGSQEPGTVHKVPLDSGYIQLLTGGLAWQARGPRKMRHSTPETWV